MSSRLAIPCPYCKRPMATSPAFAGQMIACPSCRGEFVLTIPAIAPSQSAAPAPTTSTQTTSNPPAFRFETPPATSTGRSAAPTRDAFPPKVLAAPQPPPNTARFKVATAQSPAVVPAADGKLPELQLADATPAEKTEGGDKAVPLWLACLAVVASTILSAVLLLYTPPEEQSAASHRNAARRELAQYYGSDAAQLRSYQILLREAQQAYSRGDRALERQRYRDVLRLLRAEGRSQFEGLTGTKGSDEQLSKLLAILLAED